jgi:hypothetical protein
VLAVGTAVVVVVLLLLTLTLAGGSGPPCTSHAGTAAASLSKTTGGMLLTQPGQWGVSLPTLMLLLQSTRPPCTGGLSTMPTIAPGTQQLLLSLVLSELCSHSLNVHKASSVL